MINSILNVEETDRIKILQSIDVNLETIGILEYKGYKELENIERFFWGLYCYVILYHL